MTSRALRYVNNTLVFIVHSMTYVVKPVLNDRSLDDQKVTS